ncbi:MAG: ribose-5-phosphate isomerase RpiA [Pseudomonadota bacterium]|nr:ribose-5-phosphate isomerase RpiA [Pseudomonadota bacterium]
MDQSEKKKLAARAAIDQIESGIKLGVGSGSTVNYFIDLLPEVKNKIDNVVSSSEATSERLKKNGFEISELSEVGDLDLYIDGADEVNQNLQLIKGGGGALTREKILAAASYKFVCIIDDSKLVDTLGKFPLPVEVIPMARSYVSRQFIKIGGKPILREGFITDNGNQIIDIQSLMITNPEIMEDRLSRIPGVVTVGIFAYRGADIILSSGKTGLKIINK